MIRSEGEGNKMGSIRVHADLLAGRDELITDFMD